MCNLLNKVTKPLGSFSAVDGIKTESDQSIGQLRLWYARLVGENPLLC